MGGPGAVVDSLGILALLYGLSVGVSFVTIAALSFTALRVPGESSKRVAKASLYAALLVGPWGLLAAFQFHPGGGFPGTAVVLFMAGLLPSVFCLWAVAFKTRKEFDRLSASFLTALAALAAMFVFYFAIAH